MAKDKQKLHASRQKLHALRATHAKVQKKYKVVKVGFVATALAAGALAFNTYSPDTFNKLLKDVTKWVKDNPQE